MSEKPTPLWIKVAARVLRPVIEKDLDRGLTSEMARLEITEEDLVNQDHFREWRKGKSSDQGLQILMEGQAGHELAIKLAPKFEAQADGMSSFFLQLRDVYRNKLEREKDEVLKLKAEFLQNTASQARQFTSLNTVGGKFDPDEAMRRLTEPVKGLQ